MIINNKNCFSSIIKNQLDICVKNKPNLVFLYTYIFTIDFVYNFFLQKNHEVIKQYKA